MPRELVSSLADRLEMYHDAGCTVDEAFAALSCDSNEPECECVLIDADLADASMCPVHGPNGEAALRARLIEAAEEAAYWRSMPAKEDGTCPF